MSHTASCENARGYSCTCRCGNARHGGILITALGTSTKSDRAAAEAWAKPYRWGALPAAVKQSTVDSLSKDRQEALTGVVAELVTALITHRRTQSEISVVHDLARAISKDVAAEFEHQFSHGRPSGPGQDHVWCVTLAAICRVFDQVVDAAKQNINDLVDSTMDVLSEVTSASRTSAPAATDIYLRRSNVARAFDIVTYTWSKALIKNALEAVVDALNGLGAEAGMTYVRLLGAIMCPNPDRHPAVVKHCMWPLLQGPFRTILEETLEHEMSLWMRNAYVAVP